jgi:cytoskeletal protein RodZ
MRGFRLKKLEAQPTLGDELKQWRERRGLSVKQAAEAANLQEKYILAFENNVFDDLPELLYARNFLKSYLKALGLKEAKFLKTFEDEWNIAGNIKPAEEKTKPTRGLGAYQLLVGPRILTIILVGIIGLAILGYLAWQINALLKPPKLVITYPPDDIITEQAHINISGQTEAEAFIQINNQEVITNNEGGFTHPLDLQRGLNIVTIKAWKRHSRTKTIYKKIILESN